MTNRRKMMADGQLSVDKVERTSGTRRRGRLSSVVDFISTIYIHLPSIPQRTAHPPFHLIKFLKVASLLLSLHIKILYQIWNVVVVIILLGGAGYGRWPLLALN